MGLAYAGCRIDPDRFDGLAVTLQGTVEKFREGVSPDGAPYFKFRLSDEQTAIRVFSFGRLPYYQQVTATHVTCR